MQKNPKDFYDATKDEQPEKQRNIDAEIAEVKKKAATEKLGQIYGSEEERKKTQKRNYILTVIGSLTSVIVLLVLAIVFFIFLQWHGAGIGLLILAIIVSQVWLHFFKKWNKTDMPELDGDYLAEMQLQQHLKEKQEKLNELRAEMQGQQSKTQTKQAQQESASTLQSVEKVENQEETKKQADNEPAKQSEEQILDVDFEKITEQKLDNQEEMQIQENNQPEKQSEKSDLDKNKSTKQKKENKTK